MVADAPNHVNPSCTCATGWRAKRHSGFGHRIRVEWPTGDRLRALACAVGRSSDGKWPSVTLRLNRLRAASDVGRTQAGRTSGTRIGPVLRPRFSWTRIKGESDVQGGSGNGSVEEGEGSWVGAAAGARALAPGQRWSASRKRDVVLRLLCGESLDAVSRAVGVEIYRLEEWKARALAGLELGLKDQAGEPVAAELDAAKRHIGELSMENELLRERARAAERRLPLATRRSRR